MTILRAPITLPTLIRTSPSTHKARLTEAETITQACIVQRATSAAAVHSGKIARDVVFSFASAWVIAFLSCDGDKMGYGSEESDQPVVMHRSEI